LAGQEVRLVAHADSFRLDTLERRLEPGSTVYLHGGGNFGDMWPDFHTKRLAIIEALHRYRVVVLPQTMWFRSGRVDDRTRQIVDGHPDITLWFRDRESFELGRASVDAAVGLAPDMALALGPQLRKDPARVPVLWLGRTDRERRGDQPAPDAPDVEVTDWPGTQGPGAHTPVAGGALFAAVRATRLLPAPLHPLAAATGHGLSSLCDVRRARGLSILSRGRVVVTDRLHGHILSCLLGLPHVLVESGYGKVSRFHDSWTASLPGIEVAPDHPTALDAARRLLGLYN
jgi:pyruvyl transferase EpsO